jgi:hypothetical protein
MTIVRGLVLIDLNKMINYLTDENIVLGQSQHDGLAFKTKGIFEDWL